MSNTTIIQLGDRRYRVTCLPDEPATTLNNVEAYISITEFLKKKLLTGPARPTSQQAIQLWLDKFPKPIK